MQNSTQKTSSVVEQEKDAELSLDDFEGWVGNDRTLKINFFLKEARDKFLFFALFPALSEEDRIVVFPQDSDPLNEIGKVQERNYGTQFLRKIQKTDIDASSRIVFQKAKIEFLTRLNLKLERKAMLFIEGQMSEQYETSKELTNSPFFESVLLQKGITVDDEERYTLFDAYKDAFNQLKTEVDDVHGGKNNREDELHNIYTKVDLVLLYVLSDENRNSLHPKLQQTFAYFETKEDAVNFSLDNLFSIEEGKLTVIEPREIVIFLTTFLLKLLEEGKKIPSLRKTPYDGDTPRLTELESPNFLLRRAYEIMCEMQEKHFKAQVKQLYFPYAFSSWGEFEETQVPRMLPLTAQSLADLRLDGDNLECTACKEGSETFYGKTYLQGKSPEDERKNYTGMCVKKLDALLEEAGILEEEKGKPWYVNFIGTWEQAQRRLDLFEKEMERLRLIGDKKYNFLNYYSKRFILYIDVAVKKLLDLSTVKSETTEEQTESWVSYYLGEWGQKLYDLFKKVLKVSGLMFYKFVSLILQSPFMFEVMLTYIKSYYDDICLAMAVKNTKQTFENGKLKTEEGGVDILRSKGSVVERFFYERGTWVELTLQEKEKQANEESDAWYGAVQSQARSLYSAMADYISLGKWQKTVDAAEFVNSGPFSSFMTALESVPVFAT